MAEFRFINWNKELTIHQIEKEEVDKLKHSRKKLVSLLELEELYDLVIESFMEFKTQLYSNSLHQLNNGIRNSYSHHECRSKLNRYVFNILNLSKLYLDKHYHEKKGICFAKDIANDNSNLDVVRSMRDKLHKENPEYVLGCVLRNLTQHSTLPIDTLSISYERDKASNRLIGARFYLTIKKEFLITKGVNKNKLKLFDSDIDIHEVLDGYIFALSQIHMSNRKLTKNAIESARQDFSSKQEYIHESYGKPIGKTEVYDNDTKLFNLEITWFELVEYLQTKHIVETNYYEIEHGSYLNKKPAK